MEPNVPQLPLRDIHIPESISWWPPAPGWWALLALFLLLLLISFITWRFRRRRYLKRASSSRLEQLFTEYQTHGDSRQLLNELSLLMRRIALSHYPRNAVAGLAGRAWLEFLDLGVAGTAAQGGFSSGAGAALAQAPYRPEVQVDMEALHRLCIQWADNLPVEGGR